MGLNILSFLLDHRIQAVNVLVEVPMKDYLEMSEEILNENEFQRKRVINSQISALLREDILTGCSVPPLVLAVNHELVNNQFDYKAFSDKQYEIITEAFTQKKLLILDGKQRTHVFLRLWKELTEKRKKPGSEEDFAEIDRLILLLYSNVLRIEVYLGINKLNILYRMLTLNSGQTSMSTRHLMEMLYIDYLNIPFGNNIRLIPEKADEVVPKSPNEFVFKDVLDGFTSYLDKDENPLDRSEILDNIKSAQNIKKEENEREIFERFVLVFKKFVDKVIELSEGHVLDEDELRIPEFEIRANPFGKSTIQIFKRSQTLSGFGAAIGELKEARENFNLDQVDKSIAGVRLSSEPYWRMALMLNKHFDNIRDKSKKIGSDQRFYFKMLFRALFDPESSNYQKIDKAVEYAYKRTREEKYYLKDLHN